MKRLKELVIRIVIGAILGVALVVAVFSTGIPAALVGWLVESAGIGSPWIEFSILATWVATIGAILMAFMGKGESVGFKAHKEINMSLFFNTTFAPSMVSDGVVEFQTLSAADAAELLGKGFENVANPTHSNTLQAVSQLLGLDVTQAQGGRVLLGSGDQVLVAQVSGIPRETREFTNAEIQAATFEFRLVTYRG